MGVIGTARIGSKAPQYGVSDLERLTEQKKGDCLTRPPSLTNRPVSLGMFSLVQSAAKQFSEKCFIPIIRNVQNYYVEHRPG